MADHCPRDVHGFCWIALWQPAECGGVSDRDGGAVRCPETPEEAQGRMEAARQHRIAEVAGAVASREPTAGDTQGG